MGYTETQASNLLFSGGLEIHTTQDPKMQAIVDEEVNNPDNYDVVYYSVDYQLSVTTRTGPPPLFRRIHGLLFPKRSGTLFFQRPYSIPKRRQSEAISLYKDAMVKERRHHLRRGDPLRPPAADFLRPHGPGHRRGKGHQWRPGKQGGQPLLKPGDGNTSPAGLHL